MVVMQMFLDYDASIVIGAGRVEKEGVKELTFSQKIKRIVSDLHCRRCLANKWPGDCKGKGDIQAHYLVDMLRTSSHVQLATY